MPLNISRMQYQENPALWAKLRLPMVPPQACDTRHDGR
jgi:hypothetical protein